MSLKNSIIWTVATAIATVVVAVSYFLVALNSTSYNNGNEKSGELSSLLALMSVIAFGFAITAIFRVHGWKKIVPILCSVVILIVFGLALFAASFIGYGSPN